MKGRILRIALIGMLMFGAFDMLRGVSAPLIEKNMHVSYSLLGTIFSANSFGYFIGSFTSGWVIERLGIQRTVWIAGFGYVAGIVQIGVLPGIVPLFTGFAVAGWFSSWMEIGLNAVIPALRVSYADQAKYFNWLHGFYGVGAFVSPLIAGAFIAFYHQWRMPYLVVALGVVLVCLWAMRGRWALGDPEVTSATQAALRPLPLRLARQPALYLLVGGITAYVMAEVGFATWLPLFLVQQRHVSPGDASWMLAGFYGLFTLCRLGAHFWVHRLGEKRSILVSSAVATGCFILALAGPRWAMFGFVIAGLAFAIVFPTIAALATRLFEDQAGRVLSLLFGASGVGSLVVNALIGVIASRFGLPIGFSLVAGFLIFVFIFIVPLANGHGSSIMVGTGLGEPEALASDHGA